MKKLLSVLCVISLAVSACGPRDVALKNNGGSGNGGNNGNTNAASVGTFSEMGTRADCPEKTADYKYIMYSLGDPRTLTGEVTAYMAAGSRNCLKIGSEVDLVNPMNAAGSNAKATIVKVDIAKASSLTKAQATALGYATAKEAIAAAEDMNAKALAGGKFDPKGLISITYFDVEGATGTPDDKGVTTPTTPTTPVTPDGQLPAILTFATEGERSSTCPATTKDYLFFFNPTEFDAAVFEGKVTAGLSAGDRNCYKIGTIMNLQNSSTAAARGQVLITQVQIVHLYKLGEVHARAMGMTLADLKTYARQIVDSAKAAGKFDPRDMVNITFFEVMSVGAPAQTPVQTPVATPTAPQAPVATPAAPAGVIPETITFSTEGERANCPEKNKDFTYVYNLMEKDADVKAGKITAVLAAGDRSCYRIGSVIPLQNGTTAKVRAQLKMVKAEIVHKTKLTEDQAKAFNMTLAELQAYAQKEIDRAVAGGKFNPKDTVNLAYFEVQSWVEQTAQAVVATPAAP